MEPNSHSIEIMLPDALVDWMLAQPEDLSTLYVRLLEQERARQEAPGAPIPLYRPAPA